MKPSGSIESAGPIGDEVGAGADVVGDDAGCGGVHDLIDDEAPGLMARGKDEDAGEGEEGGQLGLVAEAEEADAGETGGGGLGFERGALFAVADDEKVGIGLDAGRGRELGVCGDEVVAVLARLELGGEEDDGARGIEAELGLELSAAGRSVAGALGEVCVVHGVGHEELWGVGEVVAPVFGVERADGKDAVDERAEGGEEEVFERELERRARAVAQPGLGADEDGNAEQARGEDAVKRVGGGVAVDPEGVEGAG